MLKVWNAIHSACNILINKGIVIIAEIIMHPALLDILVCPLCKGKLIYDKENQELICRFDRLAYPIRHNIPVMLESEAREIKTPSPASAQRDVGEG